MWTVTKLARACGLSRTTVLYYESIGLLKAVRRGSGNYRCYTEDDLARLRQICVYRDAGLKLEDIGVLLGRKGGEAAAVLRNRLVELDAEIARLRGHQQAILALLKASIPRRIEMVSKEKFVAVMKAAGFTEEDMQRWHTEFEKLSPVEHQEFLEFLHIPAEEI
ncbi:MAG: MerR family transcriptional regulator, partial [Acidobacteria bacterium]|nr:MerR family transcriptional regulator [Acidobacteriota bacterium]